MKITTKAAAMKLAHLILLPAAVATVCISLSGCTAAAPIAATQGSAIASGDSSTSPVASLGRDRTVTPTEVWNAPGAEVKVQLVNSMLDGVGDPDIDAIAKGSDLAIRAVVKKVSYTHVAGIPYTLSDVEVQQVLAGDAKVGDRLTIVQPGGFVPLRVQLDTGQIDKSRVDPNLSEEQIDKEMIAEHRNGEPFPEVGDTSVYFLMALPDEAKAIDLLETPEAKSLAGMFWRGWIPSGQFRVETQKGKEILRRDLQETGTDSSDPDASEILSAKRLEKAAKEHIAE